ncbi:MAG: PIN domain-containing protein, partial [Alteraurantiacibacter sp. bin_em_oilr2.035]|nr:PIN domain-containing protein [Alteraurantiacibacter sp. bin_em_oilr2.035]
AFIEGTGAEVVPANLATVDGLLKAYFEPTVPFEASGDKKSEYPDAIALMSLEQWARSSGRTILAASPDKGWKAFADKSDHITVEGDLGGALEIVQDDTDAAVAKVNGLLRRMTDGELGELMSSISDNLSDALLVWDFEIEASSYLRYEVDAHGLKVEQFNFVEQGEGFAVTIVRLEAEETAVQVDVEITATAAADFSLYAWDSIDREEIGLGTTSASSEEKFPGSILITFLGPLAGPPEKLDIDDVEVVEGLGSVNMGEIEMNYGDDDADDYDQLQLALTATAVD